MILYKEHRESSKDTSSSHRTTPRGWEKQAAAYRLSTNNTYAYTSFNIIFDEVHSGRKSSYRNIIHLYL